MISLRQRSEHQRPVLYRRIYAVALVELTVKVGTAAASSHKDFTIRYLEQTKNYCLKNELAANDT